MPSIIHNVPRVGNFTSSDIVALVAKGPHGIPIGAPFYTYIEECNMERRLMRSITRESNARELSWGKLGEKRVFDILPMSYTLIGDQTIVHPFINCWAGSPDATKQPKVVCDVKCPLTLNSFCQLVDPYKINGVIVHPALSIQAVRKNHPKGEQYYWQLVSNAVLTDSDHAELIVYVPYLEELENIRAIAVNSEPDELHRYYWITGALDEELPYLIKGAHYENLNVISFPVPQADKDFLTDRVLRGQHLLEPWRDAA